MKEQQIDFFNEYIKELETYKWVSVKDLSNSFDVSERTVFQWLKDGKIEGIKWKNRRLINTVSVIGFLLKKRCLEKEQIRRSKIKESIELKEFQKFQESMW